MAGGDSERAASFNGDDFVHGADSVFVDSVFVDSVFVDSVFVDSVFVDSVFVDSVFVHGAVIVIATGAATTAVTVVANVAGVHKMWAWVFIIGNALAGIWSLAAHWIESLRTRALWWFTVAAEVSVFIQVMLGVWMVSRQKLEPAKFHLFYGFIGIIAVGILYAYRQQLRHKMYLLYGFGGLFIMGLGIRAILVGQRAVGG